MGNPMHVREILADASTEKNGAATENLVRQGPTKCRVRRALRSVNYGEPSDMSATVQQPNRRRARDAQVTSSVFAFTDRRL
jgi:hypothetical protein